ncbi:MAG: M36 family metallopeptidase [Armatimonadetes bacterium]|nr:M36 family metallopeptidase [Armatimonadota bacterium]
MIPQFNFWKRIGLSGSALVILLLIVTIFCAQADPSPAFRLSQQLISSSVGSGPSPVQARALAEWQSRSGAAVQGRFNQATGSVHHLFRFKGALTGARSGKPADIALDFIASRSDLFGLDASDLAGFKLARNVTSGHNGASHLSFQQYYKGVPVVRGGITCNVDSQGRILSIGGDYVKRLQAPRPPRITPTEAIKKAAAAVAPDASFRPEILYGPKGDTRLTVFDKGPFIQSHGASLVLYPVLKGTRYAWKVILHKNAAERYALLVDAKTSDILLKVNLVCTGAQGLVFEKDPGFAGQVLKSFAGDPTASPAGWVTATETAGNNVFAQEDWAGADSGGHQASSATQDFSFVFKNTWETSGAKDYAGDVDAAITNLFYWNNLMHDHLYALGFDEASGNFQEDNFGKGGFGGDPVQADAQDSVLLGYYGNASFYTPPDGADLSYWGYPKMTMYLFRKADGLTDRDSDFAGDAMAHEYVHGLSSRLVSNEEDFASLLTIQGGAMGEGWSDFFGVSINNDPVVGAYLTGDYVKGIRHYAYNNSPLTYADFGYDFGPEVHNDGEIWAAALYDLRQKLIDLYGLDLGRKTAEQLVVDGMKFCVHFPDFLDGRDALLIADMVTNNGAHQDIIWEAFAARGMGWAASTTGPDDYQPFADFQTPPTKDGRITGAVLDPHLAREKIIESAHPYGVGDNVMWVVSGSPKTTRMRLHFSDFMTEYGYDEVVITDVSDTIIYDSYTGYDFDFWTVWIPANTVHIWLVSDDIYNDWGFRIDQIQTVTGVSGATVNLSGGGGSALTGAIGQYTFNAVKSGAYTATASAPANTGWVIETPFLDMLLPVGITLRDQDFIADDTTPPSTVASIDDGTYKNNDGKISASWSGAADPETAVVGYAIAIGSTPGGTDVRNWIMVYDTSTTQSGLSLQADRKYYWSVKAMNEDGLFSGAVVSDGVIVTQDTYVASPGVYPAKGDTATYFAFSVDYVQAWNIPPSFAYVVIVRPDKTETWRALSTVDSNYTDGSTLSCRTKLPAGTYSYYFVVAGGGQVMQTNTRTGPTVYNVPTLSGPAFTPAMGTTQTNFIFTVNYTQAENQTPKYVQLVTVDAKGNRVWHNMASSDKTYQDGSLFTYKGKLPAGASSYYFQCRLIDSTLITIRYTGPTAYSAPTLTNGSVSPSTGSASTNFTFAVTYTQAQNLVPLYVYLGVNKPDGTPVLRRPMRSTDTTYSDGSRFSYTTKLPVGNYVHFFYTRRVDEDVTQTLNASSPTVN